MFKTLTAAVAAMALIGGSALAASHDSSGEVVKIDKSAGKITLKHAPIRKLDMDSMTMVFRVKDPTFLSTVKPGDKVQMTVERVDGVLTIVALQRVP